MRRILFTLLALASLLNIGCARVNPRLDEQIDNQNGKIDEIKNNQNGVNLELGKIKADAQITNSQLKEVQSGLVNINAAISKNENSGVQILQGDGALMMVFGLGVIGMLLYYYRDRAVSSEKAANIIAREVALYDNPELHENILRAALNSESEHTVFHLLMKHED